MTRQNLGRCHLSKHAWERLEERQIRPSHVLLLVGYGDIMRPDKNKRQRLEMTERKARQLRDEGLGPRETRRLSNLVVIVARGNVIVTAYLAY